MRSTVRDTLPSAAYQQLTTAAEKNHSLRPGVAKRNVVFFCRIRERVSQRNNTVVFEIQPKSLDLVFQTCSYSMLFFFSEMPCVTIFPQPVTHLNHSTSLFPCMGTELFFHPNIPGHFSESFEGVVLLQWGISGSSFHVACRCDQFESLSLEQPMV